MPIEWVTLSENPPLKIPSSKFQIPRIPLDSPDLTDSPEPAQRPIGSPLKPLPPLPLAKPISPTNPLPPDSPVPAPELQGLEVPLGNPLIPLPSPSSPQDSAEPWDSLEPLPSVPVLNPATPGNDRAGESSGESVEEEIDEEIRVAANPTPVQFRVTIEVVASPSTPENPGYTPPRPQATEQIFTADPLTRSCSIPTLEAVQASGTPLQFQVAIDATGTLTQALPMGTGKTGLYADYQTWAVCLLQGWPFDPAQIEQVPVASNLAVSINIQVLSSP